jgi:N-acetylglucosamine-6-sulfatase
VSARVLSVALVALAALGIGAARAAHQGRSETGDSRPNVVVIETDDQTFEEMRVLKKTQALIGRHGVTFDNSFVSLSLCCPSRATFLTGQYAHNHGVISNDPPLGGYQRLDHTTTLPVWLQKSGYRTAFVGKYLNGYRKRQNEIPPGWNDWHAAISLSYFVYKMNDNGTVNWYGSRPADYQTDVFTRKAKEEIRDLAGRRPFFLWVSYFAPHVAGPHEYDDPPGFGTPHPAPKYQNLFTNEHLPTPPSFNEVDVSDKPLAIRNRAPLTQRRIAAMREAYQQELESLLSVDDGVEKIVDELRATGQLENTVIIFTNDNGYFHGEHRIPSGKVLPYEQSIRVPLLVRGPGVPEGLHLKQLASNVDLAPTILDFAHAKPIGRVPDGRSLRPLFRDPKAAWDDSVLLERLPGTAAAGAPGDQPFAGVRTRRYLYVEYDDGEREQYDLAVDPDELRGVQDDPAYAGIEAQLSGKLSQLRHCVGDECRSAVAP